MAWYVNDLSICGQYQIASRFLEDLKELMRLRQQIPILKRELFCSRALHTRPVTSTMNFREVVSSDKALTQIVLSWLTKNGPFWDDDRQSNPDDYFEYQGLDVTDHGLGEAARRQLVGEEPYSVSFSNAGFDYSPVAVMHGLPQDPLGTVLIKNLWEIPNLQDNALAAIPPPINWQQMLDQAQVRFDKLVFSTRCIDALIMEPFSAYVVERSWELLRVLNEFMQCRNDDGSYSDRNNELIKNHFSGEKAWFTDESEHNQQKYREEMSFPDPEQPGVKVLCSWHGKIKSPQYRMHFEWPSQSNPTFRVFYIGPKITKD